MPNTTMTLYGTTVMFLLLTLVTCTNGHGRLYEPPSRSTMWHLNFGTPANYNDNQLNCGGFQNQYEHQQGRCGICGDPFQGPRENEAGGKYATGIITRTYSQGQVIDVVVDVTANHLGWFEFKICPNNNPQRVITQECLDRHVLSLADGSGTKLYIGTTEGFIELKLRLPADLTCSQCVIQWHWYTGKDFGIALNGTNCKGCGNQEEFYGCSDIRINPTNPTISPLPPILENSNLAQSSGFVSQLATTLGLDGSTAGQGIPSNVLRCRAISANWIGDPEMDLWCQEICLESHCPPAFCACN